jgi:hypothetical protein
MEPPAVTDTLVGLQFSVNPDVTVTVIVCCWLCTGELLSDTLTLKVALLGGVPVKVTLAPLVALACSQTGRPAVGQLYGGVPLAAVQTTEMEPPAVTDTLVGLQLRVNPGVTVTVMSCCWVCTGELLSDTLMLKEVLDGGVPVKVTLEPVLALACTQAGRPAVGQP